MSPATKPLAMVRKSTHQACYTLPDKQVHRAKLVLYAADGMTKVEIFSARHGAGGRRALVKTLLPGAPQRTR